MTDPGTMDHQARQWDASAADAALRTDRLRQAALRLAGGLDAEPRPEPAPTDPAPAPLAEAVSSSLGDIDAAGSRLLVWPTHVELLDARGRSCARIDLAAVDRVDLRRRVASTTIAVVDGDGMSLVLKGAPNAEAARLRDVIEAQRPAPAALSTADLAEGLRNLRQLAAMGLLTDRELADKRARLHSRARGGHA